MILFCDHVFHLCNQALFILLETCCVLKLGKVKVTSE